MITMLKTARALALAAAMPAAAAHADLTEADLAAISGKSGLQVFASDGAYVGVTNGVTVKEDRTRLFVIPRRNSIFRRTGRDVTITTFNDRITRRGDELILDADGPTMRLRATRVVVDDDSPISVVLLGRKVGE